MCIEIRLDAHRKHNEPLRWRLSIENTFGNAWTQVCKNFLNENRIMTDHPNVDRCYWSMPLLLENTFRHL